MSIERPFGSNTLPTFVYEPFSYTISNPSPGTYTLTLTNVSTGLSALGYLVNNASNVVFSTSSNGMGVGTESFTVVASQGGSVVSTSSNIVTVGAGRFLTAAAPGGSSYVGSNFAFFKNEPITPIPLVAPFAINVPTSVPTLPPGLTFTSNASNSYSITGTPIVTVPQSNYLFIGKAATSSKIVTSQFALSSSNERVLLNLSGSPIVSPMTIGTAITPRVITARFPPYPSGGTLRYNWPGLPDGLVVTNSLGVVQPPTFFIPPMSDASSTLIISGTPTLTAANAFRDANISNTTITFTGTRVNPLPQISNSQAITFGFGETVLFDTTVVPTLYTGVALDPSATSFRAQTYFGTGSAISNIFSPDLRSDLSLSFVGGGRAWLTGTPSSSGGPISYIIRAINSNAISRDLLAPITVTADSVAFNSPPTPAVDICYNFVLSRPLSQALSGYYTSNIQFQATAASGKPITFSAPALAGTGLSLSNVSANVVQLVGTADSITPLTTVTVTASAVGTPATATRTFKLAVLNDVITFSEPTSLELSFIQNRAITPIQLTATTLSGRSVTSFTSTTLPSGLSVSTSGLITGTPSTSTGGTFTVIASTGFMSQSKVYTYTLTPDSLLLIEEPQPSYALTLGGAIPAATVVGLTYSGLAASNYVFIDVSASTYGITIGNTTGVFGGTLTTSFPPDLILPSNVTFSVQATAGLLTESLPVELNTSNAPQYEWLVLKSASIANTRTTLDNWTELKPPSQTLSFPAYTDYSIRPIDVSTRTIVAVSERTAVSYSSNGTTFIDYDISGIPWPFTNPSAGFGPMTGFLNMGPKFITRVGNTTTLYGTSYDWQFTNIGAFWTSLDDGLTWTVDFPLRATGITGPSYESNAVKFGNAIAYKNGTLLIAGQNNADPAIIRSVNEGNTWAIAGAGSSGWWGSAFCTDAARWIFAGSSYYASNTPWSGAPGVRTLLYSDDDGADWSNVTTGDFNYIADFVVYGNGIWIAAGREGVGDTNSYIQFRSSTDGLTWTSFTLNGVTIYPEPAEFIPELDEYRSTILDSLLFDGENFIILLRQTTNNSSEADTTSYFPYAYAHLASGTSFSSGWTETYMPTLITIGAYASRPTALKGRYPIALDPPTPVLNFPSQAGNGPTVTSPTDTLVVLYQYATMTPITFSATGTGTVYFFVRNADLPRGLTFNSVTNTLSGTPMLIGTTPVTFYVKDNNGVTLLTLEFRVIVPSIVRQQTSAGSWTSLVRQYTIVNAAQNSLNGKTLPATEPPLGEFMRPEPPDAVNVLPCPKC
jgi:hypothetical protein